MSVDVAATLGSAIGQGAEVTWEQVDETFSRTRQEAARAVETAFRKAGWYHADAEPYPFPSKPIDAPVPRRPPTVQAIRNLWLAKFNPADVRWEDPHTRESGSDVDDERYFPWSHPEAAAFKGNYWLSTTETPKNRTAIEALNVGDLVVIQRSDPKKRTELRRTGQGATDILVGVALASATEAWDDIDSGRRERRVSLLPAARFRWAIPRALARQRGRITGGSFQRMPQKPDGTGQPGFTLSAIAPSDWTELLAVCGLHPDAMAEPDPARLAARLRATANGNHELWRYRWDHVFRHSIRVAHERAAVAACKVWADGRGLIYRESAEYLPGAGYDLLFVDAAGRKVQIEVKGYLAASLALVHLQPSQADRARAAAAGTPPDWMLYALLKVDKPQPVETVKRAGEVVALIDAGGLQVNRR